MLHYIKKGKLERLKTDVVIVGSGAAGLMVAGSFAPALEVVLLSKLDLREGCTNNAQGGIACAIGADDSLESHIKDTIYAGAGLCDEKMVRILVGEGPAAIEEIAAEVKFDQRADGGYYLGREAAHARARILHAGGDATGRALEEGLMKRMRRRKRLQSIEYCRAFHLIVEDGRCTGLIAWMTRENRFLHIAARAVVLACGGYSQLFQETTNPRTSTGDAVSLALEAGAEVMDMEFVQFHPTALFVAGAPRFLISEAVRGDGAILRNAAGQAFMPEYHELADLAPRDVVSRAIVSEMIRTRESCVFLDLSHLQRDRVYERFPTIRAACQDFGLDIARQWIPVRPAAHYTMGGVRCDEWGRSSLPGLYVGGESAASGVHGANRLASNSLLEGLVFGRRIARHLGEELASAAPVATARAWPASTTRLSEELDPVDLLRTLKALMWRLAGVYREKPQLDALMHRLQPWLDLGVAPAQPSFEWMDFHSLRHVALAVGRAALERRESRGAHYRRDFPDHEDSHFKRHLIWNLEGLMRGRPS